MFPLMIIIGGTLTGFMTYLNIGFQEDFIAQWFHSFIISIFFMMPIAFTASYIVNHFIVKLLDHKSKFYKNIAFALVMATTMELVLSFIVTMKTMGTSPDFVILWITNFSKSFPLGFFISLNMSFFIKPRIEKILKS